MNPSQHTAAQSHAYPLWELKFVIPELTYMASLKWGLHQKISPLTARRRPPPGSSPAYLGGKQLVDWYLVLKCPLFGTELGDGYTVVLQKCLLRKVNTVGARGNCVHT